MENNKILEEIKNETVNKLTSLNKSFIKYQIFAFCACIIYGVISALIHSGNSFTSDVFSSSATGILYVNLLAPFVLVCIYLLLVIFWLPSTVAKKRGHACTNIIQLLNLAGIFTIITWFIAAAWALFPSEKSLIDPLVGNVTGLGRRNVGDTIGAVKHGMNRGTEFEKDTDKKIDNLIDMHSKGLISDEEFKRKKIGIIQRDS